MNRRLQLTALWCGPAAMLLFFVGIFPLAGLLPPLSPNTPVAELQAFYSDHQTRFLLGMICMLWGAALILPLSSAVATQLQKIEGGTNSVASKLLMATGILVSVEILLPAWVFATLAYRPGWSPEVTQAFSDLGWLVFTWPNPVIVLMTATIGIAVLSDQRTQPIYPRWVGFTCITASVLFLPSCFLVLFKTGPIAWDGLLAFWTPAADYGTFLLLMTWATYKSIKREGTSDGVTTGEVSTEYAVK